MGQLAKLEKFIKMAASQFPDVSGLTISTPSLNYPWTEDQLKVLQEHREYTYNMCVAIESIARNGPVGVVLPKKPKKRLESLLEIMDEKNILSGRELHEYLCKHLVQDSNPCCPNLNQIFPDLESIEPYLREGFKGLACNSSSSLTCHLDYGLYLRQAYALFQKKTYSPHTKETWKDYLQKNVGISATYAKQMRDVSELFSAYKKFNKLGLSFNEIHKKRKEIANMFHLNPDLDLFWRQEL